jgi:hypothetical protein
MAPAPPTLTTVLGLLSLLQPTSAAVLPRQTPTPLCTLGAKIPKLYTFSDLHIDYAATGAGSSNASFTITNTQTNTTEALSCPLRISYQCQFNGTPKNPTLTVWLQLNLAAYFSFLDTKECDGKTASITGQAEMPFTCPDTPIEQGQACVGDVPAVDASGLVDFTEP